MAKVELPDQEYLLQRLRYNPDTGGLFWRYHSEHAAQWNGRWAGKPALSRVQRNGYMRGDIDAKTYSAHRVIWKMMTGKDPDQVDHLNGNRSDNRWQNLRNVNSSGNNRNKKISASSVSGVYGVQWEKDRKKWRVSIHANGKNIRIGRFNDLNAAVEARRNAEKHYGYHPNHGRR